MMGVKLKLNCTSCNNSLYERWQFCPFCGKSVNEINLKDINQSVAIKENRITERFIILARDYKSLTGHALEGELLRAFVNHPAAGRLSMVETSRRLTAGKQIRISLGANKYSLDLTKWLEAVYEVEPKDSISRVWITEGGLKYHAYRDCKGMSDGQEYARWKGKETYNPQYVKIRQAAFVLGLLPCLVCKPPRFKAQF